jgi:dephospho-CoA kinase
LVAVLKASGYERIGGLVLIGRETRLLPSAAVRLFGLTGGIGAGKSTVSADLVGRGAVIVDGDRTYAELTGPGGPVVGLLAERFGPEVVADDGSLARPVLAAKVFSDPEALADLNRITHPLIGARITEKLAELAATDQLVVLDIPLMTESTTLGSGRVPTLGLIVVDVPEDVAVERLVGTRGMTEADARARIAAQSTRTERNARADFIIDNSGTREELAAEVDRLWAWLEARGQDT